MRSRPISYRVRKLKHLLEGGHVVVVNEDSLDPAVEEGGVVGLLAAQVEHLVPEQTGGKDIHSVDVICQTCPCASSPRKQQPFLSGS